MCVSRVVLRIGIKILPNSIFNADADEVAGRMKLVSNHIKYISVYVLNQS